MGIPSENQHIEERKDSVSNQQLLISLPKQLLTYSSKTTSNFLSFKRLLSIFLKKFKSCLLNRTFKFLKKILKSFFQNNF